MDKLDLETALQFADDRADSTIPKDRALNTLAAEVRRLQSLPQGGAPEIDPCRPKGARVPEKWIETYAENDSWGPVIQALARDLMDMTVAYGSAMKKLGVQGAARIQEAGIGAPGVRECWVKFVDGAPWAVNIRPYHYMENCEWVHMVEATPSNNLEGHNEIA